MDRERDLDRFLTFVDAVAAIAITLLVLPLVELTGELDESQSVADLLRAHQSQIWAFLLSFAVIARLWFAQHRSVRHVLYFHDGIASLTVLWALTIVFLPFPTALVAQASDEPLTKLMYIGTMTLSTVLLALAESVIVRNPGLSDGRGMPDPAVGWSNAVLLAVALAVSLAVPATSYFPLLLLLLADRAVRMLRRLRGRGSDEVGVGE